MPVSVLLVTPSVGFGELIRQTLEESPGYAVTLATEGSQALAYAREGDFAVAIVDADLPEPPLPDLWARLRSLMPATRLILVPPAGGLEADQLQALAPDGLLNKPFYHPSLLATVIEVLNPGAPHRTTPSSVPESAMAFADPQQGHSNPPPPWLEDVERAAQHLAQLSLETAAEAALITRQGELWAYAGELPQPAADELARAVGSYWAHDGDSDLARFVRLEATGEEYMLYATALSGDLVLSLVFAAKMPFSQIRAQAVRLAHALASTPNGEAPSASPPDDLGPAEESAVDPTIEPLLDDVPPPTPRAPGGEHPLADELEAVLSQQPAGQRRQVWLDLSEEPDNGQGSQEEPEPESEDDLRAELAGQVPPAAPPEAEPPEDRPGVDSMPWEPEYPAEAQPAVFHTPEPAMAPVPGADFAPPTWHQLQFTFVLVPRMPDHRLAGDLGARLREWMGRLCLAFAWRLHGLNVLPDRFVWRVELSPETSPMAVLETVRQVTSQRIFDEFPRLLADNPAGDFWAPGFLALTGWREPTDALVTAFVQATRSWQGAPGRE